MGNRRDRIETDEGKENDAGSTEDPPESPEIPFGLLDRIGVNRRIGNKRGMVCGLDKLPSQGDKQDHDQNLDAHDDRVEYRRLFDASHQNDRQ